MDGVQMFQNILDIISAFGVIGSIFFIGYQVLQNTKAVKSSTLQSVTAMGSSIAQTVAANRDIARIYRVG